MAAAEIIGAAVGVMLLVIVAYVVVGSTLYAAETVANTQKDLTIQQETRMRTAFEISDAYNTTEESYIIKTNISNTGTEIISDFKHMDVIVYDKQLAEHYHICTYDAVDISRGHWHFIPPSDEFIHPNELDPGESYQIQIFSEGDEPKWFQITTGNGVSASAFI
jgi:archaeal flagellar protein FlaF